jgi:hypothetical protein
MKSKLTGLLIALAVGITLTASIPPRINGQTRPVPHDLSGQVRTFENHIKDIRAMENANPVDKEVLQDLEHSALTAEERLYAANTALEMYYSISSQADRANARRIVKEKFLDYYSWAFDQEVTRTTGELTFIKGPAVAALGLHVKDDMRAAKDKLDAIATSLQ